MVRLAAQLVHETYMFMRTGLFMLLCTSMAIVEGNGKAALGGPRLLRPVGPALGLYFRPGWNDHKALLGLLAEGQTDLSGLVFDPCLLARQTELRTEARRLGLEAV